MIVLQVIITIIFFTAGFYFSYCENFRMAIPVLFVSVSFFLLIVTSYLYEMLKYLIFNQNRNIIKAIFSKNISENNPEFIWGILSDKKSWNELSGIQKEAFSIGYKAGVLYERCGKKEFKNFFSCDGKDTPGDSDIQERKQG